MTIFAKLRDAANKHRAYIRTRDEIASMTDREALDIGIFREDAATIAYQAVYGR